MPAVKTDRRQRIFEIDALRGLALFLMILHHLIFDLRYLLELNVFKFQEDAWFLLFLQPFFVGVFLVVSGISCSFSHNNTRRGLRLLLLAVALSILTVLLTLGFNCDCLIIINILHVLAIGILLTAVLFAAENKGQITAEVVDVSLLIGSILIIWSWQWLPALEKAQKASYWLIPLGLVPQMDHQMADYMPLIPWLGVFLSGVLIGRRLYQEKITRFGKAPDWLRSALSPLQWLGRHSLAVYALHQPILLAVLFGLRYLKVI